MKPNCERLCKCHSEPMIWNKRKTKYAEGYWKCRVKQKISEQKYHSKEEVKIKKRIYEAKYYRDVIMKNPYTILKRNAQARLRYRKRVGY
jgi:hypothetical protein